MQLSYIFGNARFPRKNCEPGSNSIKNRAMPPVRKVYIHHTPVWLKAKAITWVPIVGDVNNLPSEYS